MATIKFTSALRRFFPDLRDIEVPGTSVSEVVEGVELEFPGIKDYLLEEDGHLRQHVNIFIKDELIRDKESLSDPVDDASEILIYQALSGG